MIDPNAVLYLNSGIVPKPNLANGDVVTSANQPIDVTDYILRVDHNINDKWHLLGHYMHDAVSQAYAQPMLGWSGASYNTITSTLANPSWSATVKLAGTITPNLLLEASFNYDGNIINIINSPNSLITSAVGQWTSISPTDSTAIPTCTWARLTTRRKTPVRPPGITQRRTICRESISPTPWGVMR